VDLGIGKAETGEKIKNQGLRTRIQKKGEEQVTSAWHKDKKKNEKKAPLRDTRGAKKRKTRMQGLQREGRGETEGKKGTMRFRPFRESRNRERKRKS